MRRRMREYVQRGARRAVIVLAMLGSGHSMAQAAEVTDGPLPAPWIYADVGSVGVAGNATWSSSLTGGDTLTVRAAGADIWGTADSFGYVYQPFVGDGWASVAVLTLQNSHTFAKSGLMLRESLDPASAFVIIDVRPTGDIEVMIRRTAGAATEYVGGAWNGMPAWLMLYRNGSTVTAYVSDSNRTAKVATIPITMPANLIVGVAVTSHDASALTTSTTRPPNAHNFVRTPTVLTGWRDWDLGTVDQPGGTTYDNGIYTVRGAGADIWGTADSFHFYSQALYGGEVVARVLSVQDTDPFAKAGIDLRLGRGGAATDAHVVLDVRPTGDVEFMTRTDAGQETTYLGGTVQQTPVWLKLAVSGQTINGYVSVDGSAWTLVGSAAPNFTEMYNSDGWITAGLVVCSHQPSALNTATFDNLALIRADAGLRLPAPWVDADVGDVGAAGTASWQAGIFTIAGAGDDIWGSADAFHMMYQEFDNCCGDNGRYPNEHLEVIARVLDIEDTNTFAKAGVMIRSVTNFTIGGDASVAHVILDVRPTGDVEFMTRSSAGGDTQYVAGVVAAAPVWLKLVRSGDLVTGYVSSDGLEWTTVGSTNADLSGGFAAAGTVVSSHDSGRLNHARFDHVEVWRPQ